MPSIAPTPSAARARLPVFYIHTDEQWEAVCSDVRAEIVRFLTDLGPCSIAQLAAAMDTAPDGLYHHIRRLASAGLIRALGLRHTGRRRERLYDVTAERLRLDVDVTAGRNTDRLRRLLGATLQRTTSIVADAIEGRIVRLEEPIANTLIRSDSAPLDEEDLARVQRHLAAIAQVFAAARASNRGRLHSLTSILSPLVRARNGATRPTKRLASLRPEGS